MKNFSKKLSFVMATAMVVTSLYAPQEATAAAKNAVVVKGSTKVVKSKNIYLTGKTVDFDAIVKGKNVKSGTWKSSNKKVATVNKNGVVKAVKAGKVTISFKTKGKKPVTVKTTVNVRVRAAKMMLTPAAVTVKEGEKTEVMASYELSKKVQAAGGKATTYKLFAESSDEKVATVSVDGNNKIMVKGVAKSATPATITVYAAQVNDLAKAKEVKIKLTEKFDVKVNGSLEAKQSGANKITVMGSDLTASKAAFVVKNSSGVVLPLKDMVKLNEAKNEAVLEGDTTQIPVGKYTLSYNNSDPVEFEVVKAVVKSIEIIPTGKAIMGKPETGTNIVKKAYAYYKVMNQFGEDITKSPLASRIQISGSDGATMASKGKIEFTSTSVNGYQLNLSQISVAVVDIETGVNANAILTAGEASKVWETEYKGLFDLAKRKFVENISESDKLSNFAILIGAKDQYGNSLVHEYSKGQIQVNLLSITGVNTDSSKAKIVTVGDDDYYAFTLKGTKNQPDETADRAGEVSVQSIVINNGKMDNHKFNVVAGTKVDTLNVRMGALGVYEGQDNWLEFTALDAAGKEITSWDSLKALNNSTNMPNYADGSADRKLMFVKKSDGKVGLVYNPGDNVVGSTVDTASITQVLSFISKTNKFSSANLTVRKKRMPVSIIGIESDTVRGTTATDANREFVIKAEKIRFQDQYGNSMTADDVKKVGAYQVSVNLENKNLDNAEGFRPWASSTGGVTAQSYSEQKITLEGNGTKVVSFAAMKPTAATAAATGVSKVTLKLLAVGGNDLRSSEARSFEIYNARLQDMSSFSIEDPGLRPASNLDPAGNIIENSDKGFEPSVIGYYAGYKVSLLKKSDFTVYGNKGGADETFAPVPSIDEKEGNVVKKAIARVIINDNKGTQIDREFSYSREARKVAKTEMNGSAKIADFKDAKGWNDIKTKFDVKVKDQYGAIIDKAPYITFSDYDKSLVTITKNGNNDATIMVTGKTTLTVKFAFPGSSYVFEKVITFDN